MTLSRIPFLEAMAMQLPVISTKVTGIPEVVEDGVSGLLVPSEDEQALATAIIQLIENPELAKELGISARKRVDQKFDISKNIIHYLEMFGSSYK